MNIKEKWLATLRSGQYKQGKFCLRQSSQTDGPDEYCCLGVLCDILDKDGWCKNNMTREYDFGKNSLDKLPAFMYFPGSALFKEDYENNITEEENDFLLRLRYLRDDSIEMEDGHEFLLTYLNDNLEWSFEQIADFIEEKVPF